MSAHDFNHLIGCYALAMTLGAFKLSRFAVIMIVGWAGVLWEILDQLNHKFDWQISFLDSRGWDSGDILMDAIGLILAVLMGMIVSKYREYHYANNK